MSLISADMCYIPDDVFSIVGRYLEDDCVSLLNLVKTKKVFGDIIRTEVNIDEMKKSYIDYLNCLKLFTYVRKMSDYSLKLEITTYDLNRELAPIYEEKIKRNKHKIDKALVLVKHPRCLSHFDDYISDSYQITHHELTCYIGNRIRLMASQKLYDIILSIDSTYQFRYDNSLLMNWIRETNYYNSDDDTYQDFNY